MIRASYHDPWWEGSSEPCIMTITWRFIGTASCCSEAWMRWIKTCRSCIPTLSIHCHIPIRLMEYDSTYQHDHEHSFTPWWEGYVSPTLSKQPKPWDCRVYAGYSEAWKGWIKTCRSCTNLINPLPYTLKADVTYQHTSTWPWADPHTMIHDGRVMWALYYAKTMIFIGMSADYSKAQKGWIKTCISCTNLANQLPYTH